MKMKQMIGSYRFFYNQGIKYLLSLPKGYYKPKTTKEAKYILYEGEYFLVEIGGEYAYGIIPLYDDSGKQLSQTNMIAIRKHLKMIKPDWFINLPAHLIDQASREVADNYKKTIEARKLDKKRFSMNFKSKKMVIQTISMEGSSLGKKGIYSSVFKGIDTKIYTKEPVDVTSKKEYDISYNKTTHKYYISFPVKNKDIKINNKKEWCSIDPGEKTFLSVYNPYDKNVVFIANNTRDSFNDSTIFKLQRKIHKTKKNKSLKKALQRARDKDKNKRKEMHHKICNYLCSNFKQIIIPSYRVKTMKLGNDTNRHVRNLGYYQFLTFLKHKCVEHNTKLYIVDEHYTTQACCRCGSLNKPTDREYKCSDCGIEIHRDANGSVNIGLKHLTSKKI